MTNVREGVPSFLLYATTLLISPKDIKNNFSKMLGPTYRLLARRNIGNTFPCTIHEFDFSLCLKDASYK